MKQNWFSASLGDAQTAVMACREIENAFAPLFMAAGRSPELAVFTRSESEGRLHCEVTVYFSPAAQALAEQFGAWPCSRPASAGLDMLAGAMASWALLFDDL